MSSTWVGQVQVDTQLKVDALRVTQFSGKWCIPRHGPKRAHCFCPSGAIDVVADVRDGQAEASTGV